MSYQGDTGRDSCVHILVPMACHMTPHRNEAATTGQPEGPVPFRNNKHTFEDTATEGTHVDISDMTTAPPDGGTGRERGMRTSSVPRPPPNVGYIASGISNNT